MVEERGLTEGNLVEIDKCCTLWQGIDMVNSKRARREKPRTQIGGSTYVKPKDLSSGLKRVREVAISASALPPEVGAQCISSACWDLCGGRPVRAVPTATK